MVIRTDKRYIKITPRLSNCLKVGSTTEIKKQYKDGGSMKLRLVLPFVILIFSSINILAQTDQSDEDLRRQMICKNPFKYLTYEDEAYRLDAAFILGHKKCAKAVIPLMKLLREDPSEAVRIVAAQSLIKIGDPVGVYLVQRSAQYNDFAKVRNFCEKFYNSYLAKQSTSDQEDMYEYATLYSDDIE